MQKVEGTSKSTPKGKKRKKNDKQDIGMKMLI